MPTTTTLTKHAEMLTQHTNYPVNTLSISDNNSTNTNWMTKLYKKIRLGIKEEIQRSQRWKKGQEHGIQIREFINM